MSDSIEDNRTKSARPQGETGCWKEEKSQSLGQISGFHLLRVLGSGGMGVVYEAIDPVLHRSVAIKSIKPEYAADAAYQERFLREARTVAAIEHENVVPIYSAGTDGCTPYLVMPLLTGETLAECLTRSPALPLWEVVAVARGVAAGLAAVHARGLIHRDIKPSNIWLDAESGRARIFDFGLARSTAGPEFSKPGAILGTPAYMAPEQAAGQSVDHCADLFSLGCVLYQMLVGTRPFSGADVLAVLSALATHHPPAPHLVNPTVPLALSALVGQLLSKLPGARPASAVDVFDRLGRIGPDRTEPIPEAGAETVAYRPDRPTRRRVLLLGAGTVATVGLGGFGAWRAVRAPVSPLEPVVVGVTPASPPPPEPIKVGVLFSTAGTMAVSENPVIDATLLAIEELNAAGGVLGRPVRAVVVNGDSDPAQFQTGAERLIRTEKVVAIFGCMTSPSRKAVRPVVERDNGLLFFPVSYEGLEQSPRIVYVGSAPNQKFLPGVEYLVKTLGKKRLFVIGSDLVSPRSATQVVREHLKVVAPDARIVDSVFIPLGSTDVAGALDALAAARPDAVVNVLNGSSNFSFYRELRKRGVRSADVPVLSISLSEHDLVGLDPKLVAGDYLAANYFQAVDREESRAFLQKVRARFGDTRVVTDNMVSAYTGVHIWARAVAKAGTPDPAAVAEAVKGVEYDGPGGVIRIDPTNQHAWRRWRVGQVQPDGKVKVVDESKGSVRADPFPATRTRQEWERLLTELYVEWGGRWQAPTSDPEKK